MSRMVAASGAFDMPSTRPRWSASLPQLCYGGNVFLYAGRTMFVVEECGQWPSSYSSLVLVMTDVSSTVIQRLKIGKFSLGKIASSKAGITRFWTRKRLCAYGNQGKLHERSCAPFDSVRGSASVSFIFFGNYKSSEIWSLEYIEYRA